MDDLISRQAAIDIVVFECGEWSGLAKEISKQLKQLPSAQPEIVRGCGEQKCYHPELKRTVKRMAGKNDGLEKKRIE